MRKKLSLLWLIIMTAPIMAQNRLVTDWERDNLKGNVEKVIMIEKSGGKSHQTIFEYDNQGHLTKKVIGDYMWIPINDDAYREKNSLWFGYDNGLSDIMVLSYNSLGQVEESKMYEVNSHTMTIATQYKYDSSGLIESIICANNSQSEYLDGYTITKCQYRNDSNGNIIEEYSDGKIKTYNYTLDKKGNWIRKDVYTNNKLSYYFERQISYYQ